MPSPFPFPITEKHFIGLPVRQLKALGYDPAQEIVPAWFGFITTIDTVPETCLIDVSGRSQFKFFVNGQSLLFGPCRGRKEIAYYDTLDIAPYLVPGENRILMQVLSYPENPESRLVGPNYCYGDNGGPAVMLEGTIGDKDPGEPDNWVVWLDRSMQFNSDQVFLAGAMEDVDGRVENPLFGDDWSALPVADHVQPMSYDPFGCRHGKIFQPRPIQKLYRRVNSIPGWEACTVTPGTTASFVLDAGRLTTAYFRIGFAGGRNAKVRLTYAESYFQKDENGRPYKGVRDDASGYIDGIHDTYIVSGTEGEIYEPFRFRTFRFIQVDVTAADDPVTILPQEYIETAYPLDNCKKPIFTDPAKEKLYDVAFRTLQLCAHDTYEDCPYYEQLMYAGDSRLEMLFTYAATDELDLPRQAIRLFVSSMQANGFTQARFPSREDQIIPDFCLYIVMMLEDYVNHTGDLEFVRPFIPIAERIVETFLAKRLDNGLLAPQGYWDYFDWTQEWAAASMTNTPTAVRDGASALQNVFFVYAAQALIRLLPKFDRASLAEAYQAECDAILKKVRDLCYVPEKGLFKEGPVTEEYSQHTQIYAVLTGLVQGDEAYAIMEKVLDDKSLIQCSFVQKFYLFRALEKVGLYDRTEELWQAWQDFIDLHCTTFPETPFDPRSDCHAWSALPLYEFAEKGN